MARDITIVLRAENQYSSTLDDFRMKVGQISDSTDELTTSGNQANDMFGNITGAVTGAIGAYIGFKGVELVGKMVDEGEAANRTSQTFDALTDSIGGHNQVLYDMANATGNVVTNLDLMSAANSFLQMGIADNSDELASLTSMAVRLGSAMGHDAKDSVESFALMLSNSSLMRLDTFGISSAAVRVRMEELKDTVEGISRSDAFKMAVLEIGGQAVGKLGNAATAAETPLDRMIVKVHNLKIELEQDVANAANTVASFIENLAFGGSPSDLGQMNNSAAAAAANATAYAQRYHEALGSEFKALGTADLMLKIGFEASAADPTASITDLANKAFEGLDAKNLMGVSDEDQQRMYGAVYAMLEQQHTAEATAKAQQDAAAALVEQAHQAELLKSYQAMPEDRTLALGQQREALALAQQHRDATIEYSNAIAQVGFELMSISGEQDPMSQMYTGKLDADQVAGMLPEFMDPANAEAVTQQFKDAQTELFRLHNLADQKLISDDQLTQAENLTSNLGLMASQAQKAADAFKNLTLGQALGQSSGGMQGEIEDQILNQMKSTGASKAQIDAMKEQLDKASGRETDSSDALKNEVIPLIAKMSANHAAQAMANLDQFLKDATLQGLTDEQIAAAMPGIIQDGIGGTSKGASATFAFAGGGYEGGIGRGTGPSEQKNAGKGDKQLMTSSMSKDMVELAKDSETVSDNLASIARSTTAAARVADVFQKAINEIPNTKKLTIDFSANDPLGLVTLVKRLLDGHLDIAGIARDNGGQLPGTGNHANGGGR